MSLRSSDTFPIGDSALPSHSDPLTHQTKKGQADRDMEMRLLTSEVPAPRTLGVGFPPGSQSPRTNTRGMEAVSPLM